LKFERYGKGIAKGLGVTIRHLFRQPVTTQYPEEKLTVSRRIRGSELVLDKELCIGCSACARACPHGCIEVVAFKDAEGKRVIDKFEWDAGRCIFCGLCVEACPRENLYMGYNYEWANYRRQDLIQSMEDLAVSDKRRPSGYANPKVEESLPQQTLLINQNKVRKLWRLKLPSGY
jgi:NAD(P)H-quinone oxidoreductase subunit I